MRVPHFLRMASLLAISAIALQACSSDVTTPLSPTVPDLEEAPPPPLPELRLRVTKSGAGYWESQTAYDWDLTKSVSSSSGQLSPGSAGTYEFTVEAERTSLGTRNVYGVRGEICVENVGGLVARDFRITDRFLFDGYILWKETDVDVSAKPELNPGETHCYPYDFELEPEHIPVAGQVFYNLGTVIFARADGSILDFPGNTLVDWPSSPTATQKDESLTVVDEVTCPPGLSCSPLTSTHTFTASGVRTHSIQVQNQTASCGKALALVNRVRGAEGDSGEIRDSQASVTIDTGSCASVAQCTRLVTQWVLLSRTSAGKAEIASFLPLRLGSPGGAKTVTVTSAQQAVDILSLKLGAWYNPITIMYAELLATKLNVARGSDPSSISATLSAADALLATRDYNSWNSLSTSQKQSVLRWTVEMGAYNLGLKGPKVCR